MGESGKCLREKGMRHEMKAKKQLEELTTEELTEVSGGYGYGYGMQSYGYRPVYGFNPNYGFRPVYGYRPFYGYRYGYSPCF
jgi:bacteriocin-like protein